MRTGLGRGRRNDGVSRWCDDITLDALKIVDQIFTPARVHFGVPWAAKSPGILSGGDASFGVSQRKQFFAWAESVKRLVPQKAAVLVLEP